jgi:hypothetical protein
MRMLIPGRSDSASTSSTRFYGIVGWLASQTQASNAATIGVAGNILGLWMERDTNPGSGVTDTIDLFINGSSVGSFTFTNGNLSGSLTGTFAIGNGDEIYIQRAVSGGNSAACVYRWTVLWEGTTAQEAFTISRIVGNPDLAVADFASVYGQGGCQATQTFVSQVQPLAKTITRVYCRCFVTPSPGNYTFCLVKNGVAQDGTGGTPDTNITIGGAGLQSVTGLSLSISPGDLLSWRSTPASSPASTARMCLAYAYTPSVDGRSYIGGISTGNIGTSGTVYVAPGSVVFNTTESLSDVTILGTTSPTFRDGYFEMKTAPGTGDSRTFTVRRNRAASTITAAVSETNTQNSDTTHSEAWSAGDELSVEIVAGGTPANSRASWGLVQVVTTGPTPTPDSGVLTFAGVASSLRHQINMPDEP